MKTLNRLRESNRRLKEENRELKEDIRTLLSGIEGEEFDEGEYFSVIKKYRLLFEIEDGEPELGGKTNRYTLFDSGIIPSIIINHKPSVFPSDIMLKHLKENHE